MDQDVFALLPWLAALLGALLLQVGTNLANDYYDHKHGADTKDRRGPRRASASGDLSPINVRNAAYATFLAAAAVGVYLILVAGWPVLAIGLSGILAGLLYTAGPKPLGYLGLGDVLVLLFFGPVAVMGTVFVQAPDLFWKEPGLNMPAFFTGLQVGLLATAILVVNNLRDRPTDAATGKRTLAVRFGDRFSRMEYSLCLLLAFLLGVAAWQRHPNAWLLLPLAAFLLAIPALRRVWTFHKDRAALNPALGQTALVLLAFAVLESVAVLM